MELAKECQATDGVVKDNVVFPRPAFDAYLGNESNKLPHMGMQTFIPDRLVMLKVPNIFRQIAKTLIVLHFTCHMQLVGILFRLLV